MNSRKPLLKLTSINRLIFALYERLGYLESGLGEFTTSGTYVVDDADHVVGWTNGPQVLLIKNPSENTSKY